MGRRYAIFGAVVLALATVFGALAEPTVLEPFTQAELDTNWVPDRQAPTGGVTSVSAHGRENVARIGIDSTQTQAATFRRTEGIKTAVGKDFGDGVQVDLYVDPDWQNKAVRAGLWVVGDNGAGARDDMFGILEFVNNEPCPEPDCSNPTNITDHTGWRIWDTNTGTWTNVATPFTWGKWYTLTIELDSDAGLYRYFVGDTLVGTGPGGQHSIFEVFLNSYNYGEDNFPTLSSASYAAHWHGGLVFAVESSTYTLCVNRYTSEVSSPVNGTCAAGSIQLMIPSPQPLKFCINPYSGQIRFQMAGNCPAAYRTHVVPNNGDLQTCVNRFSGVMRYVYNVSQCGPYEVPNVIAAGI